MLYTAKDAKSAKHSSKNLCDLCALCGEIYELLQQATPLIRYLRSSAVPVFKTPYDLVALTPRHLQSNKSRAASHHASHACKIESTLLKSSLGAQNPASASMRPAGRVCLPCAKNSKNEVVSVTYWRREFNIYDIILYMTT